MYIPTSAQDNFKFKEKEEFNPLNGKLNAICKPQLAELFCGVFKFCECLSENLTNCLHTNMTQGAFRD